MIRTAKQLNTNVIEILVNRPEDQNEFNALPKVVLSPWHPDYVCIIWDDRPPELHSLLGKTALPSLLTRLSDQRNAHGVIALDENSRVDLKVKTPAVSAAFRPLLGGTREHISELALAFGDEDYVIHRFTAESGNKLDPIEFEFPTHVKYNHGGRFLVVGNAFGEVALIDLEYKSDKVDLSGPRRVDCVRVEGPVAALDFDHTHSAAIVGTEHNKLFRIDWHTGSITTLSILSSVPKEEFDTRNNRWNTIACDPTKGTTIYAGTGDHFVASGPIDIERASITVSTEMGSAIRYAEFLFGFENRFVLIGETGLELWELGMEKLPGPQVEGYSPDEEEEEIETLEKPVTAKRIAIFSGSEADGVRGSYLAARQYENTLVMVRLI